MTVSERVDDQDKDVPRLASGDIPCPSAQDKAGLPGQMSPDHAPILQICDVAREGTNLRRRDGEGRLAWPNPRAPDSTASQKFNRHQPADSDSSVPREPLMPPYAGRSRLVTPRPAGP